MATGLDPHVVDKLNRFRRRRQRLLIVRGLCAGIVAFLLCFSVISFIDWRWLLTDSARWTLSCAGYAIVAVTVWLTSLRRLAHIPALTEIATQFEHSEPELRERLLSAVELASDNPNHIHDSPEFRSLLQGQVAQQMVNVRVMRLLPFRLIAKWVCAALLLVGITSMLLTSEDGRFRQLATRAVLPGANIARVSRIKVQILEPTPHSLLLAEDETVAIVVEVTGGSVDEVTLESSSESLGNVQQVMRGRTEVEFAANLHVEQETVEYRILAGDAITQRFRIETRPRPEVVAFHKTFSYPEYSGLKSETLTETDGDLIVLEGTVVDLELELNQPASEAVLQIDHSDSDEIVSVPLSKISGGSDAGNRWKTKVPVDQSAVYKVHLVAQETGFENVFSPRYEIRPQPDLIPRTGFLDQEESTLLLPPNDILDLKGMAEDDLPLVSLEQHISVNGAEWVVQSLDTAPVEEDDERQVLADWQWDLFNHELKSGDHIITKLVATDRRGNTGESVPLRIIVSAPEFDPDRHQMMEQKVGLYTRLRGFAEIVEQSGNSASEIVERMKEANQSADQFEADKAILLDLASRLRERAADLLSQIKEVEQSMAAGTDAYDLDLTGRVIARLQQEYSSIPNFTLTAIQFADSDKQRTEYLEELNRAFKRCADDAKQAATGYQTLASFNFLTAVAFDLDALLRQQKLVTESPTQSWERLTRQESIVLQQLNIMEKLLQDHQRYLPQTLDRHINGLIGWTERYRMRLTEAMESEEKLNELRKTSSDLARELEGKQRFDAVDGGLASRLINTRKDFEKRAGSLYVPLYQTARAMQQENRLAAEALSSEDSEDSRRLLEESQRYVAELDLRHRPSVEQLRIRRELTQSRKDSDSQYAADAGLTRRAVTAQLNQHRVIPPAESEIPDHLLEIAPAYRTLEAVHNLTVARDALSNLLNLERWDNQSLNGHTDHPRQWDTVKQTLELASQRLREAKAPDAIVKQLDQVRWSQSVRDADRKIGERRWKRDLMVGAGHELVEIRDGLAEVVQETQPIMAEARAVIAKYAPTIAEMAQQTAEQIRELEEQTTETADNLENSQDKAPEEQQNQLAELQQQQDDINQQIEDLFEALVEDANAQNLLNEEERERAHDADASMALVEPPAKQMNRALQQAIQQSSPEEQAEQLSRAAERQEETAQALELVAEHFENLEEQVNVAESREQLRQMERQEGIARQMDQRFAETDQLAEMTQHSTADLMEMLEAELQQNPAMQQALSEISRNTLEDARDALELAAADDQRIQQDNEKSDTEFQKKKNELTNDLKQLANQASQLSGSTVAQANQAAARGKSQDAQQQLAEAQKQLNELAAAANQAKNDQLLAELGQLARETRDSLRETANTLREAKKQTDAGKNEQIHADDKARDAARKDSENRRKQFHDQQKRTAQDAAKRADDAKRRADNNVRNAQNQLRAAERRVQQAKQNLNRKPDDAGLKRNLASQENRKKQEEQKVAVAKQQQSEAQLAAQEAHKQRDQINRKPMPPLDAGNPATQLADQYAEDAIKVADELSRQAEQLAAAAEFQNELTPSKNQLASSQERQDNVTQDVDQTGEDIARAARHERRLNNEPAADLLAQNAEQVQAVAQKRSKFSDSAITGSRRPG